MSEVLKHPFLRSAFNYYVALKLSAGAIAPLGMPLFSDEPAPIVRRYSRTGASMWDPREVVRVGRQQAVLTLPEQLDDDQTRSTIRMN